MGSHPHGHAQVRGFVTSRLPDAESVVFGSTAAAAAAVAAGELDAAAAAPNAGRRYGLVSVAEDIGEVSGAVTRFVLLRPPGAPTPRTGNDRTSLVVYVRDEPGSLLAILAELANRGINLTRLESRPARSELGKYFFLLDADGHIDDPAMGEAVAALHRRSAGVRFLGSYPRSLGTAHTPPRVRVAGGLRPGPCVRRRARVRSMKLILVRHGETPGNIAGRLDTAPPGPGLTERGADQAAALVDRFRGEPVDRIWTSAHLRAQLTAGPVAAERGLDLNVRPELGEFDVGDLEGRSDRAALQAFLVVMHAWLDGDLEPAMPAGESGHDILRRMDAAMGEIVASGDDTALVVSHGGVLRIWASLRCVNITTEFALANYLVNTGVIVVTGSPAAGWHCESWDLAPGAAAR